VPEYQAGKICLIFIGLAQGKGILSLQKADGKGIFRMGNFYSMGIFYP
jgi:hypothetical protein